MKKIIFAIVFALPAFLVQAQFNASKDPFITKSLANEKFSKIDVGTSHGNIIVTKVEPADARVEVYIRGNGIADEKISKEEIQSRLDQYYDLEVAVSDGKLVASAKTKNNTFNWKRALSISFQIYTAEAVSSDLKTSHGNIEVSGMSGDQSLSTSHGNINVEKVAGKVTGGTSHGNVYVKSVNIGVEMGTSHGDITADQCEGDIRLTTSNGNVGVKNLKGKIEARTSHGNVEGGSIEGEISAVTSHGNIGFSDLNAAVETSTSHGNITLQMAKGKGLNIDLHGKRINVDKLENFSGSKEENSMKGTLNGGGLIVKAATTKGTVNLELR